jgi:hypothetical protein
MAQLPHWRAQPAKARVTLLGRPKIQSLPAPLIRGLPRAAKRPRSAEEGA